MKSSLVPVFCSAPNFTSQLRDYETKDPCYFLRKTWAKSRYFR